MKCYNEMLYFIKYFGWGDQDMIISSCYCSSFCWDFEESDWVSSSNEEEESDCVSSSNNKGRD